MFRRLRPLNERTIKDTHPIGSLIKKMLIHLRWHLKADAQNTTICLSYTAILIFESSFSYFSFYGNNFYWIIQQRLFKFFHSVCKHIVKLETSSLFTCHLKCWVEKFCCCGNYRAIVQLAMRGYVQPSQRFWGYSAGSNNKRMFWSWNKKCILTLPSRNHCFSHQNIMIKKSSSIFRKLLLYFCVDLLAILITDILVFQIDYWVNQIEIETI